MNGLYSFCRGLDTAWTLRVRCAYLEFLQQNIETLELLTKWLKGQLHLFVPGKGESLQLILMVQREHLNQDPFGLQSANCKTDIKTSRFFLRRPHFLEELPPPVYPQPSSDHSVLLRECCGE